MFALPKGVAVVGREDDDGRRSQARRVEGVEHDPELVVDVGRRGQVLLRMAVTTSSGRGSHGSMDPWTCDVLDDVQL